MYKKILTEKIRTPKKLLDVANKVHSVAMGVTHKILFAYKSTFYLYCLIRKEYCLLWIDSVLDCKELGKAGAIKHIALSPDSSHFIVFYEKVACVFDYCCDSYGLDKFKYSKLFYLPKFYHYSFLRGENFYTLRIEYSENTECYYIIVDLRGLDSNVRIINSDKCHGLSVLKKLFCVKYNLRYKEDGEFYEIFITDEKTLDVTYAEKIPKIIGLEAYVTDNYFIWHSKCKCYIFDFYSKKVQRVEFGYRVIKSVSVQPKADFFIMAFQSGLPSVFYFRESGHRVLANNEVVQCSFLTEEIFYVIDSNGYWVFYEAFINPSKIDKYLYQMYGLPYKSHLALWLDLEDWVNFTNSLWLSAQKNCYETDFPGYSSGMTSAFSYAEECIQKNKPLSFDLMMSFHEKLIGPISKNSVPKVFFSGGSCVSYENKNPIELLFLSENVFYELVKNDYSTIVIDNKMVYKSKMPINFILDIDILHKEINIIGTVSSHHEASQITMSELINGWIKNIVKEESDFETILNISKFIRLYHPFHIVKDGSGRLALLVIYYLLRMFGLKPSLLYTCTLTTILDWKEFGRHIYNGQILFQKYCERDVGWILNFIMSTKRNFTRE
jgi:hypothetical protein